MNAVFIHFLDFIRTEPEINYQQALRNYIDRLKSKDSEDRILSDKTTQKLEELYNRISTSDHTAGTATSKFVLSLFAL